MVIPLDKLVGKPAQCCGIFYLDVQKYYLRYHMTHKYVINKYAPRYAYILFHKKFFNFWMIFDDLAI
jgi:hypothetical protein